MGRRSPEELFVCPPSLARMLLAMLLNGRRRESNFALPESGRLFLRPCLKAKPPSHSGSMPRKDEPENDVPSTLQKARLSSSRDLTYRKRFVMPSAKQPIRGWKRNKGPIDPKL